VVRLGLSIQQTDHAGVSWSWSPIDSGTFDQLVHDCGGQTDDNNSYVKALDDNGFQIHDPYPIGTDCQHIADQASVVSCKVYVEGDNSDRRPISNTRIQILWMRKCDQDESYCYTTG
jgi:hypothetical protein